MTDLITDLVSYRAVVDIVDAVKLYPVLREDDVKFLVEKSKHIGQVMQHTQMWRTDAQKLSIINDNHFPTIHAKFHQALLEQKVQFDQAMYLAKDFELKKLEIEELECELEEITDSEFSSLKENIRGRKIQIEIQFKRYELKQMQIAMSYRMDEVKGWQSIQEKLLEKMREVGMGEDIIWRKEAGEISAMFFQSLNNLCGISQSSDAAEVNNLISLALFAVQQTKQLGVFEKLRAQCDENQIQSLHRLGIE